jgi:RNA polymerase sigma-B factor
MADRCEPPSPRGVRSEASKGDRHAELERFREFARTRDIALRNALAEEFAWVARHCARRFADRGEPFDDLQQVALLGVVKAVERFDPDHGTSFVSFAMPTVLGELRRHFRDATWAVRLPRRLKDLHVQVGATVEFLGTQQGRPPTADQVAQHLGIGVEEVLEALDAGAAYRSMPLNVSGEAGDDEPTVVFGGEDPDLVAADDRLLLQQAIAELPARERRILALRFSGGLSQSEIAERVGVSQVHVSRMLRRSIRMLQEKLGHGADRTVGDDTEA